MRTLDVEAKASHGQEMLCIIERFLRGKVQERWKTVVKNEWLSVKKNVLPVNVYRQFLFISIKGGELDKRRMGLDDSYSQRLSLKNTDIEEKKKKLPGKWD